MKAQVLLPKVFNFPFTYNSKVKCKIGNLVEVPFGAKKEIDNPTEHRVSERYQFRETGWCKAR